MRISDWSSDVCSSDLLSDEHRDWLVNVRKSAPETVTAYKLATRDGWLMFPYLRDGELVAAKYRKLPKQFRQDADCEPAPFGWQVIPEDPRLALICEGELDALAWPKLGSASSRARVCPSLQL